MNFFFWGRGEQISADPRQTKWPTKVQFGEPLSLLVLLTEVWVRSYWERERGVGTVQRHLHYPKSIASWEAAIFELLESFLGTELVGEFLLLVTVYSFCKSWRLGDLISSRILRFAMFVYFQSLLPLLGNVSIQHPPLCFASHGFDYGINISNIFL